MKPTGFSALSVAYLVLLALLPPPLTRASVADTVPTATITATFDADTPDLPPDLTLPGPPTGDSLAIQEPSGTIRVRTAVGSLTQQPVEMSQVPGIGSMSMHAFPAPTSGCGPVIVSWRSLARSGDICFLSCTLRGPDLAIAASLEYRAEGLLTYNSVEGVGDSLPVGYIPEQDQLFTVRLDFAAQTSSLSIDGVPVVGFQDVPFPQSVTALGAVGFEAGCVATQAFAVDDISAVALCVDAPPALVLPTVVNGEELGTITFTVQASDPDGAPIDELSADLESLVGTDASFSPDPGNASGTFLWHPAVGSAGTYTIQFFATNTLTTTATTRLTIGPVGTSVTGKVIWPTEPGDEGEYDVIFTAVNAATSESTQVTTIIEVMSPPIATQPPVFELGPILQTAESPEAPTKGPVVSAPTRVQATAGDTVVVVVTATDADEITPPPTAGSLPRRAPSLVAGAVFLTADLSDLPEGRATFFTNLQPNVSAPSQIGATEGSEVTVQVSATDPDGDPIFDLVAFTDGLPPGNDAAFTAGPDNLTGTFTWTPADGQTGTYTVIFRAINALVGNTTTVITVTSAPEFLEARAFMPGRDKKIKLETLRPEACLQLEPVGDFDVTGVDFDTIVMISAGTGSVSEISAIREKQTVIADKDGNGVQDATVCFTKEDLRRIFSLLEGHVLVPVVIEGTLEDGTSLRAEITLDVVASSPLLASTVVPNPLNPEGVITFRTASRGALRVTLHDASGRLIRVLMDGSGDPGEHSVPIDGRGPGGAPLPSGVYFYRIESADGETAGRFAIVK